jgi:2-methylcitrate dehydratase PrpD
MGKALHPGTAAMDGVLSAVLCRGGLTSGEVAIEGRRGFRYLFSPESEAGEDPRTPRPGAEQGCCLRADHLLDGSVLSGKVAQDRGTPGEPMSDDGLEEKFLDLAGGCSTNSWAGFVTGACGRRYVSATSAGPRTSWTCTRVWPRTASLPTSCSTTR